MSRTPEIIHYDSPQSASIQTVTGWVDRHGRFWGNDEHMARQAGATHCKCPGCGIIKEIRSYCRPCADAREIQKWNDMPRAPWDGIAMLYSQASDCYFCDLDELIDYCHEYKTSPQDLRLIICEPTYASTIDPDDIYTDDLPEGGDIPSVIQEAFDALNQTIRLCMAPLSWHPGKTVPTAELDTAVINALGSQS